MNKRAEMTSDQASSSSLMHYLKGSWSELFWKTEGKCPPEVNMTGMKQTSNVVIHPTVVKCTKYLYIWACSSGYVYLSWEHCKAGFYFALIDCQLNTIGDGSHKDSVIWNTQPMHNFIISMTAGFTIWNNPLRLEWCIWVSWQNDALVISWWGSLGLIAPLGVRKHLEATSPWSEWVRSVNRGSQRHTTTPPGRSVLPQDSAFPSASTLPLLCFTTASAHSPSTMPSTEQRQQGQHAHAHTHTHTRTHAHAHAHTHTHEMNERTNQHHVRTRTHTRTKQQSKRKHRKRDKSWSRKWWKEKEIIQMIFITS